MRSGGVSEAPFPGFTCFFGHGELTSSFRCFLGREYRGIGDHTARQRGREERSSSDRFEQSRPSRVMDPFSHIKVVHRQREEDDGGPPQMVFRRPSFSQQVQQAVSTATMGLQPGSVSVRGGGAVPSARASLANLTSGTTFAAAARQAELNAARASKLKAKEAEKAYEAPAVEPVALGALKFTTSRRRGYVWFSDFGALSFYMIRGWTRWFFQLNHRLAEDEIG